MTIQSTGSESETPVRVYSIVWTKNGTASVNKLTRDNNNNLGCYSKRLRVSLSTPSKKLTSRPLSSMSCSLVAAFFTSRLKTTPASKTDFRRLQKARTYRFATSVLHHINHFVSFLRTELTRNRVRRLNK